MIKDESQDKLAQAPEAFMHRTSSDFKSGEKAKTGRN